MAAGGPAARPAAASALRARPGRAEAAILAGLTLIALGLRVTSLSRGLFTDEAYSLALAQRSFGQMVQLFGYEANGMPYPIVLWPVIRLFGDAEAVLRAPSVLAGTAAVPALWWAVRPYAPSPAPLLAAGLLALNPMAVFYSQSARPYAFVVLAVCLAFGALPRALADGAPRRAWAGYVASMALLGYCEILAAPLVVPAHALVAWRSGGRGMRRWLLSMAALAVSCVPLLVAAVIARGRRNALYWLPKPDRELVTLTVQEFTAGFSGATSLRWATVAGAGALLALGAWQLRRGAGRVREAFLLAACWGVLPVLLLLAVSFVQPLFWPRYVILAIPGLCMLLALAAGALLSSRPRQLLAVACTAVVAVAALAADVKQRSAVQEEWAPVAAVLNAQRSAGAPTLIDNALVLPVLGYYYRPFRAPGGQEIVQEWHDQPLPAGFVGYKDRTGYGSVPDGPPTAAAFAQLARTGGGTVWMLVAETITAQQGNLREGAAVSWAKAHCTVQIHQSVGVWLMRASHCPT